MEASAHQQRLFISPYLPNPYLDIKCSFSLVKIIGMFWLAYLGFLPLLGFAVFRIR
ncbi:hypothetical protein M426DRAFT_318808 [Hypoxylon sp. CI-4A]|nr:hypothetical protein M426DRAFT_318808 [Hypoxylon sp. CI-4A]